MDFDKICMRCSKLHMAIDGSMGPVTIGSAMTLMLTRRGKNEAEAAK